MGQRAHYDVTDTVNLADPDAVCAAVCGILSARFANADIPLVRRGFDTFTRLFAGRLDDYVGCDTWYHDVRHSLDAALAYTRLVDGYESAAAPDQQLGASRAVLGVIIALFHDAGYVRSARDTGHANGAEFTLCHVARSGDFIADFLADTPLAGRADLAREVVHFTGYEIALDKLDVPNPLDRHLGYFLGTADLLAQMADAQYLEKCRDHLFREFAICGLAGESDDGRSQPAYATPEDLLRKTPAFNRGVWDDRLDGHFQGCYRYLAHHFNGATPYLDAIRANLDRLDQLLADDALDRLGPEPEVVGAEYLQRRMDDAAGDNARA